MQVVDKYGNTFGQGHLVITTKSGKSKLPVVTVAWGNITGVLANQTDLQDALDLKVPTSRTLTINGVTQDLSADRSWTISTGITVNTTPITGGTSGRLLFDNAGTVGETSGVSWNSGTSVLTVGITGANGTIQFPATTSGFVPSIISQFAGNNLIFTVGSRSLSLSGSGQLTTSFNTTITGSTGGAALTVAQGNSGWTPVADFNGSSGTALRINTNGNILVGTTTDAGFRFDVNGTARVVNRFQVGSFTVGAAGTPSTIVTTGRISAGGGITMYNPEAGDNQDTGIFPSGGVLIRHANASVATFATVGASLNGTNVAINQGYNPGAGTGSVIGYSHNYSLYPSADNTIAYTSYYSRPSWQSNPFNTRITGPIRGFLFENGLYTSQRLIDVIAFQSNGGRLLFTGNLPAASVTSGVSRGLYLNQTHTASANNDVLVGLDIEPIFTNGAFTGVTNLALRASGNIRLQGSGFGIDIPFSSSFINMQSGNVLFQKTYLSNTDPQKINLSVNRYIDHADGAVDIAACIEARFEKRQSANVSISTTVNSIIVYRPTSSGNLLQVRGYNISLDFKEGSTVSAPFIGYDISSASKGTTGNVTSFIGYQVTDNSISSIVYGFRSLLNSGTGKWGLYFDGTANNYLAGNLFINTTTDAGFRLDVNGTGRFSGSLTINNDMVINSVGDRSITWAVNDLRFMVGANNIARFFTTGTVFISTVGVATNTGTSVGPSMAGITVSGATVSATFFANPQLNHLQTKMLIGGNDGAYGGNTTQGVGLWIYGGNNTTNNSYGNVVIAHDGTIARGNVLIGTSTNVPSAVVNVNSTTQGFLPPRMTNAQMLAIGTPAEGLMVYDTTNRKLCCYDGATWQPLF
jgi:hypothetical protein